MDPHLYTLGPRYRFSADQSLWTVETMHGIATQVGHAPSVEALAKAVPIARRAIDIEHDYRRARGTPHDGGDAIAADQEVDRAIGAVHGAIEGRARLGRGHPLGRVFGDMLDDLFPDGLGGHTRATHVRQAMLNDRLLRQLRSAKYASATAELGLDPLIEELDRVATRFRRLIEPTRHVTWEEVREATLAAENAMLRALFAVAAAFDPSVEEEVELRERIVLPWRAMNEQIRVAMRRHAQRTAEGTKGEEPDADGQPSAPEARPPVEGEPSAPDVRPPAVAVGEPVAVAPATAPLARAD